MTMSVETAEMILRRCYKMEHVTSEKNVEVIWMAATQPWWEAEEVAIGYFGYDEANVLLKFLGRDEEFIGTEALRLREAARVDNEDRN